MNVIHTNDAPAAIGPYSQAIRSGNLLFTSGQLGINPQTGELEEGGVTAQTERLILNLKAVLEAAGTDLAHVVKTTCYLDSIGDFAAFNAVYGKYFTEKPARSCFEVAALPKGALAEVEVVAEIPQENR